METEQTNTVYLSDYTPPDFRINQCKLEFVLGFHETLVSVQHIVQKCRASADHFQLDLEQMEIIRVSVNDVQLMEDAYEISDSKLTILNAPDSFSLSVENRISPSDNTALMGLYKSGDMLCTQCEPEGFRRITPSIDRPDNLACYNVRLIGDKEDFPVLLSNGNLVKSGEIDSSTHFTEWLDPFPKPTYLFAVVAGRLEHLEDSFKTMRGRLVNLRIYARGADIENCAYALESLKRAMAWDESSYGREYDLDIFNIVAVEDFNMGAMENKSLNIFNSKYIFADKKIATDVDFANVEGVIGHEYFHNWSGNRVTCRDWFQLSLKEGFTVFRDQEFSADMNSRGVKRIEDVNVIRSYQFREDAGAMAHSVQPASYQQINNFYTATVYNKGAEVVRMLHTLLGPKDFRAGTDLYFSTYDGKAVTIDDFVNAMEVVSGLDLTQFKNWYSQAGTPVVTASFEYLKTDRIFQLTLAQDCPPTPGQKEKQPFVIPVVTALLDNDGNKIKLQAGTYETVLVLDCHQKTFQLDNVHTAATPSLLRQFSAPVELKVNLNNRQLALLMHHDDDPYSRWDAGVRIYLKQLLIDLKLIQAGHEPAKNTELGITFNALVSDRNLDHALLAKLLELPAESYIWRQVSLIDPISIHSTRHSMKKFLAAFANEQLLLRYRECEKYNHGQIRADEAAARKLRDTCLGFLCTLDDQVAWDLVQAQLRSTKCMTDCASALSLLTDTSHPDKSSLIDKFYQDWQQQSLVVNTWLRAQAAVPDSQTLETVKQLTGHPGFDPANPNKVYSLIVTFCHNNPVAFHARDGSGYEFAREWIMRLDSVNPGLSASIVSAFNNWESFVPNLSSKMYQVLTEISKCKNLSSDVTEIVLKNLGQK